MKATPILRISLDSDWTFRAPTTAKWLPAEVPGCIHTDLLRNGLIPDPFYGCNELALQWIEQRDWTYRCEFTPEAGAFDRDHIDLVFDGLDTVATVRLNGRVVLESANMFQAHRIPVAHLLSKKRNRLEIAFSSAAKYIRAQPTHFPIADCNDPEGGRYAIRKQQCQFGWDWGPRLVTCGVWQPVRLEAWSTNRIENVLITQRHSGDRVTLHVAPRLHNKVGKIRGTIRFMGQTVAVAEGGASGLCAEIARPQLWWPAGQGDQPLYDVEVELVGPGGVVLDVCRRRIGLRTISLDQKADNLGGGNSTNHRFGFRVNGRLVFCKGANWIPAHSFVAGLGRADYEPLLRSAVDANMNMMRVWGGGIYEKDDFYEICDELGLLVWQDFMFACSLYPADRTFLDSVEKEASQQVQRLRHHACLALWCGNNENPFMYHDALAKDAALREGYAALFMKLIPGVVSEFDPGTPYLHSSPAMGLPGRASTKPVSQDEHDWSVWHGRAPVEHYLETNHRFVSEFGMQSYPSPRIATTFCPPEELNIFSPTFENHQKNLAGNQIIIDYLSRRYRFPKDYRSVAYLSQLNQAWCMKVAIEHFRRQQPRCLGALYWQFNDCWPVASWSSLEFGGKWKALHYAARKFFAPSLVSVRPFGTEERIKGNYKRHTTGRVELWTIHDAPMVRKAILEWSLHTLEGKILSSGSKPVTLRPGISCRAKTLDYTRLALERGHGQIYLRSRLLDSDGLRVLSDESTFFVPPRALRLVRGPISKVWKRKSKMVWTLTLLSKVLQLSVWIDLAENDAVTTENFFDLHPGEPVTLEICCASDPRSTTTIMSLADSYDGGAP